MLQCKKDINQKSKVIVSDSLCAYDQFLWRKCKELQRKGRINQVFYLGAIVTVKITKNRHAIMIPHERRPVGMPGMSPRFCIKELFFIVAIVNLTFYIADP